jgi:hypothetical protein
MAITVAVLEERVNGHIKFVWTMMSVGFAWLGGISIFLFHMNGTMNRVEKAQVDAPSRIVAGLLKRAPHTKNEMTDALSATSTILRASKIGDVRPTAAALKDLSSEIQKVQEQYSSLPAVWQTTSALINYKSDALLSASSKTPVNASGKPCPANLTPAIAGFTFSNCEIDLEAISKHMQGNTINGNPAAFYFIHCIIHYRGGEIPPARYVFDDCLFRFDVQNTPSQSGITAMERLTTIDTGDHIEFST